jgi:uncharacterized protein DUF1707
VDDPHRKPGDRDRSALVARIQRAAEAGRIAPADRDIRLSNVASAQSMAELDLMARDLDQLEATLAPGTAAATAAPAGASPAALADQLTDQAISAARTTVRSIGLVMIVVLVLVAGGLGAAALIGSSGSDTPRSDDLFTPEPIPTGGLTDEPVDEPTTTSSGADPSAGSAYGLTVAGIRSFLADYRARFGTTRVVDLTLYDDYAIVGVPEAGKKRHAGFLFRKGERWQDFGGVHANFPGARVVDLQALDVPALVRNIGKARRALNVEEITQTYAIVRHYSSADPVPSVDIHVSNDYGESGYLATTLDGSVERAYPFAG